MKPRRMTGRASGHGRLYQAAGDQHFPGMHRHQHDHEYDESGINGLFQGRGPGRILILAGLILVGFCFTGFISIMIRGGSIHVPGPDSSDTMLGQLLPSGIPIGLVYFLGLGAGAIMMQIGSSMAKAAARGAGTLGHLVATVVIIALAVYACTAVLAGAPLEVLMPNFSR